MKSRILITGAGGFIGSHVCSYFDQCGCQIGALGRFSYSSDSFLFRPTRWKIFGMTLPDPAFETALRTFQPEILVHAASTAAVGPSVVDPYGDFQGSAEVCAFTLEMVRRHAPDCVFVLLSSAAVYGDPEYLPIDEAHRLTPLSPYGFHKQCCELLCDEYRQLHGIKTVVLRIFSAYGEGLKKQVLYDLCSKFAASTGNTVEVHGTGDETRDFIHARDVARAIEIIWRSSGQGVFNVASGQQTRVADLVQLVRTSMGSGKTISFTGSTRKGDPRAWAADISRLSHMGYKSSIPLPEGVQRYCQWFKEKMHTPY